MITSEAGFIIATPTKCGTTSLEGVAKRHMRNAGADADLFRIMDWDRPRRQHRMCLPPLPVDMTHYRDDGHDNTEGGAVEWGAADRYLLVRNPFTRYMSVYTYLSAPANYSQWGAKEIQGREWGGHNESKVLQRPKMTFHEFLFWLARQRDILRGAAWKAKRGPLDSGRAYRSPWVWTDPLHVSAAVFDDQEGDGAGTLTLLRLENLWGDDGDATRMLREYGVDGAVDLSPLHANRSTGYGERGAEPGSAEFWGGIGCTAGVFRGYQFAGGAGGCGFPDCPACSVGVWEEWEALMEYGVSWG